MDCEQKLADILDTVSATGVPVDTLLLTGDLTDAGDLGAYRRLRNLVEPAAAALGAPLLWAMGNHDYRAAFRVNLLDIAPTTEPIDLVHDVNGPRVMCLDSSIPGEFRGEVSAEQAQWLAGELSVPAEHGTILVIQIYDETIVHTAVPLLGSFSTFGSVLTRDDIAAELERKGVRTREHSSA